jgi:predicted NUDIX family NTP pyrophosphohydrolase
LWAHISNPVALGIEVTRSKFSAGLLMFKSCDGQVRVLLVHPGGPFWKKKDEGAWSIPKGECDQAEDPLDAAKREFEEETGIKPHGDFVALDQIKQPSGKVIIAWAFEGDCSPSEIRSNTFSMEWPPHSGLQQEFPEVDRADWFTLSDAQKRIVKGQIGFLDRLVARLR